MKRTPRANRRRISTLLSKLAAMSLVFSLISSLALSLALAPSASAAPEKSTVYIMNLPRAADANKSNWGHGELELMNGWAVRETETFAAKAVGGYGENVVYCLEPGVPLLTGSELTMQDGAYWDDYPTELNGSIPGTTIKEFIGRILANGYTGKNDPMWDTANAADRAAIGKQIATQLLIWETVVGERGAAFEKIDASGEGKSRVLDMVSEDHPCYAEIIASYEAIEASVASSGMMVGLPGFMAASPDDAPVWTMEWDGEKYAVQLKDDKGLIGQFEYSSDNDAMQFSVASDALTVTSGDAGKTLIKAVTNVKQSQGVIVIWGDGVVSESATGQVQDVVGYIAGTGEAMAGYFYVINSAAVEQGRLKIIKTTDEGPVSGFTFRVTGPQGYDKTFVTDESGEIEILISGQALGEYIVSEVRDNASANYIIPKDEVVSINGGLVVVTMHNKTYDTPKTGDGRVLWVWLALAALSLAGMSGIVAVARVARKGRRI